MALFDEIPHAETWRSANQLVRLTRKLGLGALEACWRNVTSAAVPAAVREHVTSHLADD